MNYQQEFLTVDQIHPEVDFKFGIQKVDEIFIANGFRRENGEPCFKEEQADRYLSMTAQKFTICGGVAWT